MEGKGERREKKEEEHSSFLLIMNDLLFGEAMAKPRRGPLNQGSHDAHRHTHTHTHTEAIQSPPQRQPYM